MEQSYFPGGSGTDVTRPGHDPCTGQAIVSDDRPVTSPVHFSVVPDRAGEFVADELLVDQAFVSFERGSVNAPPAFILGKQSTKHGKTDMPGIFYKPLDRRRFLTISALSGAALACRGPLALGESDPKTLHFALLSDTHVPGDRKDGHRGMNGWENLKQIVPAVVDAKPEGVIINGDAARLSGLPKDYQELQSLLEPIAAVAPVYIGLGNHDDRVNFFRTFTKPQGQRQSIPDKHVVSIDHPAVRILVLDSLLYVNKVAGLLGREQRNWLSSYLEANKDRPVVLFLHHTLEDGDGDLLDADRLFALLAPHKQVKAIFYGHSHVWSITERQGIKQINLPAVGYNFRDQDPVGWVDAQFQASGVELKLHAIAGNRTEDGKTFHVEWT